MNSIALPAMAPALPGSLPCRATRFAKVGFWPAAGLLLVVAVALFMRTWELGAILASSDQASIGWLIRHSFGVKWILAHNYGPVLPFVQRTWAEIVYRLDLPVTDEVAVRAPIAFAGLLQVAFTFALVRRLGRTRFEAGLCTLVCAILPTVVSDAHFAWAYNTMWLLNGTIALWATLAWLQDDRPGLLLIAATALMLHCLSNCFAFAMPVTLLYLWAQARRGQDGGGSSRENVRRKHVSWRAFGVGFVVPCLLALTFIVVCWVLTGEGQIGRLAFKRDVGSTGIRFNQILSLPGMWVSQFGYLFAAVAAVSLVWATFNPKLRVLSVWGWASLLPILLFVNWDRVGYLAAYLLECAFATGLLATLWLCTMYHRIERRPAVRSVFACAAVIAILHMGFATYDACFGGGKFVAWTGVPVSWGSVRAESGIKAAGWYVRKYVPCGAIVMSAHTNTGMEVPVAEYYCGRAVVAGYDLKPALVEPLLREMHASVDVIIVEPEWSSIADSLPAFERTATFRHGGQAVRYIYARPGLGLPRLDAEAQPLNARYNRECVCRKVPQTMPAAEGMDAVLREYQQKVKTLVSGPTRAAD